MKNILSGLKSTIKSVSSAVKSGIDSLRFGTKSKVGAVLAAGAIGMSSNVYASENWIRVDKAGMGPSEFSQKYFGTSNWRLLRDRNGNLIKNPRTDFILGREYTITLNDTVEVKNDKVVKDEQKQSELVGTKTIEKEVPKIEKTVDVIAKSEELPKVASKKEVEVKKDAKKEEELLKAREKDIYSSFHCEKDIRVKKIGDKPYYVIPKESYPAEISEFVTKYNFDYEAFVNSVIYKESRGKTSAFNKGTRATGLTQFLPGTLIGLGYHKGGELSEKMLSEFKRNISLQFKYIHKYNAITFKIIGKNPGLIERELKNGKDIATILVEFGAEANFAGYRSIGRGWKGDDGSTSIPSYKREVLSYFREFVAANDEKYDTSISLASSNKVEKTITSVDEEKVGDVASADLGLVNMSKAEDAKNVEKDTKSVPNKAEKTITSVNEKKVGDITSVDLGLDETARFQTVSYTDVKNASNDRFYSEGIMDISTKKPTISDAISETEERIDSIISNIGDAQMRKSIELKISESNTTSIRYFYSNLDHYKQKSQDLQQLSKRSIGREYDRVMQEKRKVDNIISKLIRVISYAEAREAQRKAA